jgi:hypothetical protein
MAKGKGRNQLKEEFERRAELKAKLLAIIEAQNDPSKKSVLKTLMEKENSDAFYQRSIEVGHFKKREGFAYLGSEDENWKVLCEIDKEYKLAKHVISMNAVDKEEKSIIIKIHLDRERERIIEDVQILLDILDKEAEYYKYDFNRLQKVHLDTHEEDLQVYHLHEQGMGLKKIALQVYGGEFGKDLNKGEARARKAYDRAKAHIMAEKHKKL